MSGRRGFLHGAMATIALGGIGGVSASRPKGRKVDSEIIGAYLEGGPERVEDLLDDQGVEYTQGTTTVSVKQNDNQAETSEYYGEADSELQIVLSELPEKNRILCTVNMNLQSVRSSMRNPTWVKDIIGVGYDSSVWTGVGVPTVVAVADPNDAGGHEADFWPGSIEGGGLAAQVDLGWGSHSGLLPESSNISLQTELATDGTPGTIWGYYEHTWSTSPKLGAIKSISGGQGPLSVELGYNANTIWDAMKPKDPDPVI